MSVGLMESAAPAPAPAAAPPSEVAVQLTNVSRWYGNVVAVNDITFSLGAGITGLLGPNGAGKSTILHMMAGFLAPSAGEVRVAGMTAWKNPEVYRHVGLVPEREAVYPLLTAYEFALMNARLHGIADAEAAAERAIDTVDLRHAMHRRIGGYSKGMRQRAKIAGALVHGPRILLLDEPFNGMDPSQRMQMMVLLKQLADQGKTILISSHILEELDQLANNVLVIVAGRLAASGHFRQIRRLMTDRPHTFTLQSSDDRRLAAALMAEASVQGLELGEHLTVRASDRGSFALALPRVARAAGVTLFELHPTDESLESVFSYLVKR
ncbi:MAG TPA: ABC transporter ATP-binding protein [Longimicrobium sp.]|jgi:ABC-2 type transport system ATP-binding protein|uniref:ABC transporter ATP-binding protein n=1 Tax=Longimicrobium sp. TaxID=2029185 RepID=UPI002EDBB46A